MANLAPDITGQRFGRLTVVERRGRTPEGAALWLCRCDCGNTSIVRGGNLRAGTVKSCGCLRDDPAFIAERSRKAMQARLKRRPDEASWHRNYLDDGIDAELEWGADS